MDLPRRAAEIDPVVTAIFIQWRKVRSFAAKKKEGGGNQSIKAAG